MAYSYIRYTGNGTQTDFTFAFPYFSTANISVTVNGVAAPFTWVNSSTVKITTAPALGAVIFIQRTTPKDITPVNFVDGSVLLEADLDTLALFSLYAAQESIDEANKAIKLNSSGVWEAQGNRISNAADPVNAQDAVTKNYFESVYTPQLDAKVATATTQAGIATTKASEASASATSAATSATTATTKASEASASATSATSSASTATAKASEASTSAATATTKASEASTSATNSATSATNSANSAASTLAIYGNTTVMNAAVNTATSSATTATTKASEAGTSAASALTSANNASTSATSATGSASTATTKASEASTSATSAATSASTATTKASEASTSAASALSSKNAAATSETNAASSATTATTGATTATTKASEAATSAISASTSATNAASSASTALTAQAATEAARDTTLAALDSFDDRYLGQKATDPTVDNDGNALLTGALYFNTSTATMKVYEGSAWVSAYASLSGALLVTNNLSDLTDASSARTNLGLGSFATKSSAVSTDITDFNTAAGAAAPVQSVAGKTGAVTIGAADLTATGTPTSSKYLRGDNSWQEISIPIAFPSGTLMLFQQTAAPTGWTKQTTHDNKALRVVSGTASSGGTTAFTTVFANQTPTITTSGLSAGATTLSTTQIPSHTHTQTGNTNPDVPSGNWTQNVWNAGNNGGPSTGATGGGGSHSHSISGSATSSAITLNVQYVDLIIASKD